MVFWQFEINKNAIPPLAVIKHHWLHYFWSRPRICFQIVFERSVYVYLDPHCAVLHRRPNQAVWWISVIWQLHKLRRFIGGNQNFTILAIKTVHSSRLFNICQLYGDGQVSKLAPIHNPFNPNVFSHLYQLDDAISNFRVVAAWYFSFFFQFWKKFL